MFSYIFAHTLKLYRDFKFSGKFLYLFKAIINELLSYRSFLGLPKDINVCVWGGGGEAGKWL